MLLKECDEMNSIKLQLCNEFLGSVWKCKVLFQTITELFAAVRCLLTCGKPPPHGGTILEKTSAFWILGFLSDICFKMHENVAVVLPCKELPVFIFTMKCSRVEMFT